MKTITLHLSDSVEKKLNSFAKNENKSVEQIVMEKLQVQLDDEFNMKQKIIKALKKSDSIVMSPVYLSDHISDPKVNRENVFKKLSKRNLGKPLSDIIIKERGLV